MVKRSASESERSSPSEFKDEPSTPPPITPKKAKKSTTPGTSGKKGKPSSMAESVASTAKGRYMEMIFEAGLKAVDKRGVQAETGLSPAQQQEMVRKDKGGLRRAVGGFIGSL